MSLDLADIQGNILRGYRCHHARHFAVAFTDAAATQALIAKLLTGDAGRLQVTTAEEWSEKPEHCLNLGFTWAGLQALGVPAATLQDFPEAFVQGPAARATAVDPTYPGGVGLGDVGESAPDKWVMGGTSTPPVHALVSTYADDREHLDEISDELRASFVAAGIDEISSHDADALPGGAVHFGYRDGIAQPRIAGAPSPDRPDMQPEAKPGDFLLGCDYVNVYGGNYLASLLPGLGTNGTYAAFRLLRQEVFAFERLLSAYAEQAGLSREMVAAKILGRWRDGAPLTLAPDGDTPVDDDMLNAFDYAPADDHRTYLDDADGVRCPVGSHMRRVNPRGSLAMGLPHSRRLIRRSMPYGPAIAAPDAEDDGVERGLVGLFIAGDLESQYEFILRTWVNEDIATHGLRGTRDPIIGAQPDAGGRFVIRTNDSRDPISLNGLPRLVQTRASVYVFMPGIGGLRWLASQTGSAA